MRNSSDLPDSRALFRHPREIYRRAARWCVAGMVAVAASVSLISISACGEPSVHTDKIDKAERLLTENPDSARQILDRLNPADLRTARARALRAVLLTHARHKCYIEETDDSLVTTAVEYFSSHPDCCFTGGRNCLLTSLYLQGVIRENDNNLIMALHSYLQAELAAIEQEDHFMLGYIYRHFSLLYENINAGQESVYYGRKSYEEFSKTDSEGNIAYAACELGHAYCVYCEPDSAIRWVERTLATPYAANDERLREDAMKLAGIVCVDLERYTDAIAYYDRLLELGEEHLSQRDAANLAIAYHRMGHPEEASRICRQFLGSDTSLINVPHELLYASGNTDAAYAALNRKQTDDSKSAVVNARQSLTRALAEFREQEITNEREQRRKSQLVWILGSVIAALIIALILRGLFSRLKRSREDLSHAMLKMEMLNKDLHARLNYQRELIREKQRVSEEKERISEEKEIVSRSLDKLTREHEQLKQNLELKQTKQERTLNNYSNLLETQIQQIEEMAQLYNSMDAGSAENIKLVKRVNRLIDNYTNPRFLSKMEREANFLHDDVVKKFRSEFRNIKEEEVRVFLYQIFGFSSRTVSFLTNEEISMTYNRRSRLKAKIAKSDAPGKDTFLAFFS